MIRNAAYETLLELGNSPDENNKELARRYQAIFSAPGGELVLEDLKRKFFFYDSTAHERFTEINEVSL